MIRFLTFPMQIDASHIRSELTRFPKQEPTAYDEPALYYALVNMVIRCVRVTYIFFIKGGSINIHNILSCIKSIS